MPWCICRFLSGNETSLFPDERHGAFADFCQVMKLFFPDECHSAFADFCQVMKRFYFLMSAMVHFQISVR
jgi:hypothetical protein